MVASQREQGLWHGEDSRGLSTVCGASKGKPPLLSGLPPPEYRKSTSCLLVLGGGLADMCNVWQVLGKRARLGHLLLQKQSGRIGHCHLAWERVPDGAAPVWPPRLSLSG